MFENKSLLDNFWQLEDINERLILSLSQRNNIAPLLAKLLFIRNIDIDSVQNFLDPSLKTNLPNPFLLKDMNLSIERVIEAIKLNQKIGIISDYDVDGSTSASILFKFLNSFGNKIILKTPNRLLEGYGPNLRIMDELLKEKVDIIFTLDCGTSSFNILDHTKYSKIDVIVIDHHLSDLKLPNVFSIINPNRYDENSEFNQMAAVGVTFLFLMGLRKKLREKLFYREKIHEPNLLSYLDLVALGTVCDVVKLDSFNRAFVKIGLQVIKERKHKGITQLIDNANIRSTPNSRDLGFIIGPQLNAASRLDDSSLPTKLLISEDIETIEFISRKLILLNEKRKIIENSLYEEALFQAKEQKDKNFILVYNKKWHNGVLGIVASRLTAKFKKPTIVISFNNSIGVGSARSIKSIDLGRIIMNAKRNDILISGGGHKMAAGLKINLSNIDKFFTFLNQNLENLPKEIFKKIEKFDTFLSVDEINNDLLDIIDQLEPFGSGNNEPKFIIKDIIIEKVKILKEKHLMVFFRNNFSSNFKSICFNCLGTALGDYLINFKNKKLAIGCTIKRDNYNNISMPQIIIKDAMIID